MFRRAVRQKHKAAASGFVRCGSSTRCAALGHYRNLSCVMRPAFLTLQTSERQTQRDESAPLSFNYERTIDTQLYKNKITIIKHTRLELSRLQLEVNPLKRHVKSCALCARGCRRRFVIDSRASTGRRDAVNCQLANCASTLRDTLDSPSRTNKNTPSRARPSRQTLARVFAALRNNRPRCDSRVGPPGSAASSGVAFGTRLGVNSRRRIDRGRGIFDIWPPLSDGQK